ncbi:MAG TPA: NAD-dependent epimerase/dehydratase family protein, partial [Micromonospora sp.]|nr:NAD-dependent epimerase/dehydratase family protein [Micromonospora sp.]
MRLLILGGTEFVGRAVAEEALRRGWHVTLFNRGRKEPPPGVASVYGDRTSPNDLSALKQHGQDGWDAVIDTWKGAPRAVRDAALALEGRAARYVYISSRSVYTYPAAPGTAEDGPVVVASADAEDVDYAQAKRGGELAVEAAFGERAVLARVG